MLTGIGKITAASRSRAYSDAVWLGATLDKGRHTHGSDQRISD